VKDLSSNNKRIYLSPPHLGDEELKYVNDAFQSNWIAPLGPNVEAFESELANYVGSKGAVAVSSGTAAIHLALRVLDVKKDDVVFCSSLTFVASANPILYVGAIPVFIDSEPESWNMSPQALKKAMICAEKENNLPKAVIVVNIYGQSANYDELKAICNHYRVPIIEDAAESLGATYKGKKSGTLGDLGIFSFNGNKIITTSGGGMLVSDHKEYLERARFLATQARENVRHYEHKVVGYNYRLSNVLAGIGRGQLKVLDKRVEKRRKIFEIYKKALGSFEGITFMPEATFGMSNRWLTTILVDEIKCGVSRDTLINLLEQDNIEARPLWKPLHLQPLFANNRYFTHDEHVDFNKNLFHKGLCLPSGTSLTEDDLSRIVTIIKKELIKGK
jgi:pyridoxal phosphate-dependent aminotransferase EpsN